MISPAVSNRPTRGANAASFSYQRGGTPRSLSTLNRSPVVGMRQVEQRFYIKPSCHLRIAAPHLSAVAGRQPYTRTDAACAKMNGQQLVQGRSAYADHRSRKLVQTSISFQLAARVSRWQGDGLLFFTNGSRGRHILSVAVLGLWMIEKAEERK